MYRLNRCGGSVRDRLDPRMLQRIAAEQLRSEHSDSCGCGCNNTSAVNDAESNNCRCTNNEDVCGEFNYSLAMVYSPYQQFQNLYCEEEGFVAGTIFKELDKPFYGPRCNGGMCNE